MLKDQKYSVTLILIGLCTILLIAFALTGRFTPTASPSPSYQPAIPASSEGAKDYISQASLQAKDNHYDQAIDILKEGIQHYPDDQNLQLTLQYYEDQQQRYAQ